MSKRNGGKRMERQKKRIRYRKEKGARESKSGLGKRE